jgi:hypothetical protein
MLGRTFSTYCDKLHPPQMAVTWYGVWSVLGKTKTKEGHARHVSCLTVTIMGSWLTGLWRVYKDNISILF